MRPDARGGGVVERGALGRRRNLRLEGRVGRDVVLLVPRVRAVACVRRGVRADRARFRTPRRKVRRNSGRFDARAAGPGRSTSSRRASRWRSPPRPSARTRRPRPSDCTPRPRIRTCEAAVAPRRRGRGDAAAAATTRIFRGNRISRDEFGAGSTCAPRGPRRNAKAHSRSPASRAKNRSRRTTRGGANRPGTRRSRDAARGPATDLSKNSCSVRHNWWRPLEGHREARTDKRKMPARHLGTTTPAILSPPSSNGAGTVNARPPTPAFASAPRIASGARRIGVRATIDGPDHGPTASPYLREGASRGYTLRSSRRRRGYDA